jgi:hypothetical protein
MLDLIVVCSVLCVRVARHVARIGEWRGAWFWCGDSREGDHLKDLGVGGEIIVRWSFQQLAWGGIDWVELAQDRD